MFFVAESRTTKGISKKVAKLPCQGYFYFCHLKIKSGLFFNDLKFKSGLPKNSKKV
jgi:hypothetical protein